MYLITLRHCRLVVTIFLLSTFVLAQTMPDTRTLSLGQPIERELAGGEVHAYTIQLTAGQFLETVVDQRNVDVVVTLFAPDGRRLEEVDSAIGAQGPETLSTLAQVSGLYRLEVRALDKRARAGRYEIRIDALREATSDDKKVDRVKAFAVTLAAVKSEDEGLALLAKENDLLTSGLSRRLSASGKAQRPPQALITHRLSLKVAERAGDKEGIAESLHNIGTIYHNQNNLDRALEHYQKSLPLSEELAEKRLLATILVNIAAAHRGQGKPELALESFQRVLKLSEASKGTGVMTARNNIGFIYREQRNFAGALENFNTVLKMSEERQLPSWTIRAMLDIGQTYQLQNNNAAALEYRQKALALGEALKDNALMVIALTQIGMTHFDRGENAEALKYYQRELELGELVPRVMSRKP